MSPVSGKFAKAKDGTMCEQCASLREQLASARKALEIFADPAAWRLGGSCDPNSGAFRGLEIAQAALTDEQRGEK